MSNKKNTNTTLKQQNVPTDTTSAPSKSRRKMQLKEFVINKGLRREVVAGFKMYVDGVEFMTEKEWNDTYNKYITRK